MITLCEKCGQTYINDTGRVKCPACQEELRNKIQKLWFDNRIESEEVKLQELNIKKEVWEMNIQERLDRILKRIPASIHMNEEVVSTIRTMPVALRDDFSEKVKILLGRLVEHHFWWTKVFVELSKPPIITVLKSEGGK